MDARRRQEQEDEALARRLQFGLALDNDGRRRNLHDFLQGNIRARQNRDPDLVNLAHVLAAEAQRIDESFVFRHGPRDPLLEFAGNRERPLPNRRAPPPRYIHGQDNPQGFATGMERDRRLLLDEEAGHWRREGDPIGVYTYNPARPPQRAAELAGLGGGLGEVQRVADWLDHVWH